jgi:hypothetical protein
VFDIERQDRFLPWQLHIQVLAKQVPSLKTK